MTSIGFTGTRHGLTQLQQSTLQEVLLSLRPRFFHHGACVGADAEAHALVRRLHPYPTCVVTQWPCSEKGSMRAWLDADITMPLMAPLKRNKVIVHSVEILVACPQTADEMLRSGTWSTIRYACKRGVPVYRISPDGSYHVE